MHALIQDLAYALRFLSKSPGFTVPAVLTLALGIGVNTAMLSVVDAVMLRPMPGLSDPGRLVSIDAFDRRTGQPAPVEGPDLQEIEAIAVLEGFAYSAPISLNLATRGEAERVPVRLVNAAFFQTLGVTPALGRFFMEGEERTASTPVAVLAWEFWQRRFGGDPAVLGQQLLLNGHTYTTVGVAQRGFIGTELADHPPVLWALMFHTDVVPGASSLLDQRTGRRFDAVGRLRHDVTLRQASAALAQIAARPTSGGASSRNDVTFQLTPLTGGVRAADRRDALSIALVGFAVAGAVLLIACANVAGLLLARASRREREIGIRIALGASRWRLVRQLLTESALLGLVAGAGGLLFAWWGTSALVAALAVPLPLDLRPDGTVLAGTLAISSIAVLASGMIPALNASRPDVASTLAGAAIAGLPRPRARLQRRLVVAQVALSVVLLATAGVLLRHLRATAVADDRDGDAARLLVASFDLAGQGYSVERQWTFRRLLLDRLERIAPVESASFAALIPLGGTRITMSVEIEGSEAAGTRPPMASCNWVSPDYFRTVGTPIVRGREFTDGDDVGSAAVVVVNEAMARRFWPGEEVIGKHFRTGRTDVTVIGVAADSRYEASDGTALPSVFFPGVQHAAMRIPTGLVVRTRHDAAALLPVIRSLVLQIDPALPVFDARTMETLLAERRAPERAASVVLDLFGALALLLTSIGVYGVMAYAVERRTREIGVRVALGAGARDVIGVVLRDGASLAVMGVTFGLIGAFGATTAFASFAGVESASATLLGGVSTLVVACMLAASWFPARRAMRVNPTIALRVE